MEYHLLWEIPAAIALLVGTYFYSRNINADDIIED